MLSQKTLELKESTKCILVFWYHLDSQQEVLCCSKPLEENIFTWVKNIKEAD